MGFGASQENMREMVNTLNFPLVQWVHLLQVGHQAASFIRETKSDIKQQTQMK